MPVNRCNVVYWYDNTDFFHYNLSAVSTAGSKIFRVIIKITEKECILLYIIDHKRKGIKVVGFWPRYHFIIPYLTIKLKDLSVFAHERNFGSVWRNRKSGWRSLLYRRKIEFRGEVIETVRTVKGWIQIEQMTACSISCNRKGESAHKGFVRDSPFPFLFLNPVIYF